MDKVNGITVYLLRTSYKTVTPITCSSKREETKYYDGARECPCPPDVRMQENLSFSKIIGINKGNFVVKWILRWLTLPSYLKYKGPQKHDKTHPPQLKKMQVGHVNNHDINEHKSKWFK